MKANGDVTASNAFFNGKVSAVNFTRLGARVTGIGIGANTGSYMITVSAGPPRRVKLVFDGSLGGNIISEMTLGTGNESIVITDVLVSNTGSIGMTEVKLFISPSWTGHVEYDNSLIYSDFNALPPAV